MGIRMHNPGLKSLCKLCLISGNDGLALDSPGLAKSEPAAGAARDVRSPARLAADARPGDPYPN